MRNWWQRFRRRRDWEEENQEEHVVRPRYEYNRQLAAKKRKEKEREYVSVQMETRETEARVFLQEDQEEYARKALIAWETLKREKELLAEEIDQLERELTALLVLMEREETFSNKNTAERNLYPMPSVDAQEKHRFSDAAAVEEKLEHMKKEGRRE